jgi:hypothetical protein
MTIVNRRIPMTGGKVLSPDELAVLGEARRLAEHVRGVVMK